MRLARSTTAVAVPLAILFVVTAVLWRVKIVAPSVEHPVFFYLMPTAFIVTVYGSRKAIIFACAALRVRLFFSMIQSTTSMGLTARIRRTYLLWRPNFDRSETLNCGDPQK